MQLPPPLVSFVLDDPNCPIEWREQELLRPRTKIDPSFVSVDDVKSLLVQRQYDVLRGLRIPPVRSYYEPIVEYYAVQMLDIVPSTFKFELFVYALKQDIQLPESLTSICTTLEGKVRQAHREVVLDFASFDNIARLHGERPELVDKLYADQELHYQLLLVKIKNFEPVELMVQARELHINPFLSPSKLNEELTSLARSITSDTLITKNRQRMLDYWKMIASVEFRTNVEAPTNDDNLIAENTLDYGSFDTIPVLEGKCLYLMTAVEWRTLLQSEKNPWTRQPLNAETLERIRIRTQVIKNLKLPEVPSAFGDAVRHFYTLYEPSIVQDPASSMDLYKQIARELDEFYITEEHLREIRSSSILPLRLELFMSGVIILERTLEVEGFFTLLLDRIRQQPAIRATVALALLHST